MKKSRLFLSSSSGAAEIEWAHRFAESLRERGFDVWFAFDERILGDVAAATETAIRNSDAIVMVLDRASLTSPWAMFELGAGVGMGKPVIPIVSRDLDPTELLPVLQMRKPVERESPETTADALAARLHLAA